MAADWGDQTITKYREIQEPLWVNGMIHWVCLRWGMCPWGSGDEDQ